jgi:hypothetical protein
VTRLLVAAYLIEAGALLILAPWSSYWQRNGFAEMAPWVGAWMENAFLRGAVSGVGVITALAGFRDLANLFFARRMPDAAARSEPPPA